MIVAVREGGRTNNNSAKAHSASSVMSRGSDGHEPDRSLCSSGVEY